jgi:hypothetical protein
VRRVVDENRFPHAATCSNQVGVRKADPRDRAEADCEEAAAADGAYPVARRAKGRHPSACLPHPAGRLSAYREREQRPALWRLRPGGHRGSLGPYGAISNGPQACLEFRRAMQTLSGSCGNISRASPLCTADASNIRRDPLLRFYYHYALTAALSVFTQPGPIAAIPSKETSLVSPQLVERLN